MSRADLPIDQRFIADVSHELRTPLAAACMALDVALSRPRTPEEWTQAARTALRSLKQISALLDAMTQLARAGQGGERAPIAVATLLARVVDGIGGDAPLLVACPPDLAARGDLEALAVALGHVVGDALRRAPAGSAVRVQARQDGDRVAIDIDGDGAAPATADREGVFEPFVRAGGGRADGRGHRAGVGLELAIARRIARGHGGDVTIEDLPSGGARFRFVVPAA